MTKPSGGLGRQIVRDPTHGALPGLLLVLTVVTGLIDAISILGLGRVFVANMTGNVVFVGFALAGAPGFSLAGSLLALAGFLTGATGGGVLVRRAWIPSRLLFAGAAVELGTVLISLVLLAAVPHAESAALAAVTLLAGGLGARNAVVRHLAVPDLTTTVLTMSLTGIGADLKAGRTVAAARRVLSVLTMLVGAVAGTLLIRGPGIVAALAVAAALLAAVDVTALRLSMLSERRGRQPS